MKKASKRKDPITKTFGEAIQIEPDLIEDDPRWPIPSVDLIEAMMWIGGQFKRSAGCEAARGRQVRAGVPRTVRLGSQSVD